MSQGGENIWQSISDMMSGLMLLFLFISIIFLGRVEKKQQGAEEVLNDYVKVQQAVNGAIHAALGNHLEKWGAEILDDNTVRFDNQEFLFDTGSARLNNKFKKILDEFFPKYFAALEGFEDEIEEIRIEGHTSSDWSEGADLNTRYINNASLSQDRALSILSYGFAMPKLAAKREWMMKKFRANGLAFAQPILNKDGTENKEKSRRVEIKLKSKSEEKLAQLTMELNVDDATPAPVGAVKAAQ